MKLLQLGTLFFCLFLLILHPYTIYGKPGVLVAVGLSVYGWSCGVKALFARRFLLPGFLMICIGVFGILSSIANGIFQTDHLKVAVSFSTMMLASFGLWAYCLKNAISKDVFLRAVLFVVVFNSVIITIELWFSSFRQVVEGYLDPLITGSINYSKGYRLRGLASSGGTGLSISVPAALTIALHLYRRKLISVVVLAGTASALLVSVLVIGRTGLALITIPAVTYVFSARWSEFTTRRIAALAIGLAVISLFLLQGIEILTNEFGLKFIRYAGGFLMEGSSGLRSEGTAALVIEHLKVLPLEFPQAFFGYGYYGEGDFYPRTDSGLARMFLSVGFVLGLIFYLSVFKVYLQSFRGNEFLIGTLVLILSVAELKEPLLFSGVASRMAIAITVFLWLDRHFGSRVGTSVGEQRGFKPELRTARRRIGTAGEAY